MNYSEMLAGPEMDLLVAQNVMEWTVGDLYSDEDRISCPGLSRPHYYDANGLGQYNVSQFRPSTNINYAMEVAEKIIRTGSIVHFSASCGTAAFEIDGVNGLQKCKIVVFDTLRPFAHPDLLCLAICRAALIATGKKTA